MGGRLHDLPSNRASNHAVGLKGAPPDSSELRHLRKTTLRERSRMARISVILPTYNRAALLPRAVASVLAQTYTDFDLWIIDDGSTDHTAELRDHWRDPRIRYERTANRGPGAARNHGCARASGELLAFIDSDDEWLPTKLEQQVAIFDRSGPEIDVVCTAARWRSDSQNRTWIFPLRGRGPVRLFEELLAGPSPVPFSSVVVRRAALHRAGRFDESLPCGEDRDLLIRLARQSTFFGLPEILVIMHLHPGPRRSEAIQSKITFEEILLRRYAADLAARPRARARALMRIGGLQLRLRQWSAARTHFRQAARAWPAHLPAYGYVVASLGMQLMSAAMARSRWSAWPRRLQLGWRAKKEIR